MSIATARMRRGRRRTWLSGGSGETVDSNNPAFSDWRGSPVSIAATWSDASAADQQNLWKFDSGQLYETWHGSLDLTVGAIYPNVGESWAQAAVGAYEARWTTCLQNAKNGWTKQSRGTLYIRFAHEWNGNWFPWSVTASDIPSFITAWRRFRALQLAIFPAAKLVFCTNANTSGQSYDWRTAWPGDQYVDIYSTDYYSNHWLYNPNYDSYGAPGQLVSHRQFAADHGKSFVISEWGNDSNYGDRPDYIEAMYQFFRAHGGTQHGELLYEIVFNVNSLNNNQFSIYPVAKAPNASAQYQLRF